MTDEEADMMDVVSIKNRVDGKSLPLPSGIRPKLMEIGDTWCIRNNYSYAEAALKSAKHFTNIPFLRHYFMSAGAQAPPLEDRPPMASNRRKRPCVPVAALATPKASPGYGNNEVGKRQDGNICEGAIVSFEAKQETKQSGAMSSGGAAQVPRCSRCRKQGRCLPMRSLSLRPAWGFQKRNWVWPMCHLQNHEFSYE
mmetsp:Transcript_32568/g.100997  ORF Transcript_32568/g.100997 Transcript_32568/m.100997 type:complete len:197 (-) Transcript_32568:128-718(-)